MESLLMVRQQGIVQSDARFGMLLAGFWMLPLNFAAFGFGSTSVAILLTVDESSANQSTSAFYVG